MRRAGFAFFLVAVLTLSGVTVGQEPKKPEVKKEEPKETPKVKGYLPPNWKSLGLTDEQVQKVYSVRNKYSEQVEKLKAQIKELEGKRDKEQLEVLTAEQRKRLEDIIKAKAGTK